MLTPGKRGNGGVSIGAGGLERGGVTVYGMRQGVTPLGGQGPHIREGWPADKTFSILCLVLNPAHAW